MISEDKIYVITGDYSDSWIVLGKFIDFVICATPTIMDDNSVTINNISIVDGKINLSSTWYIHTDKKYYNLIEIS